MEIQNKVHKLIFRKGLRRALSCITAGTIMLFSLNGFASVLGERTSHSQTEYAQGTTYNRNTFESSSVGRQTENFFEYVPNSDVLPIISNGEQIFGKRTVTEANEYLNEQGIFAAMGMNADFFSFQTGVPMSNTITDGYVLTADTDLTTGVGFNSDGTAFIAPMQLAITVAPDNGTYFGVECLNKYRQPYVMYMYTDEFGNYTNAEGMGKNVVLGNVSGQLSIGQPITATVEEIYEDNGSVEIPDGKLLISVDNNAAWEVKSRLDALSVGQTVTITANEITGESRWSTAAYGTGCLGGTLIRNGQLDFEDDSAAPRSAVGIKADGTVIFYTIDGRQQGHSYGARKETLAKRLLELGCVDAVNLDGGGSTQLGGTLPETTEFQILNSPSESLRKCANFIFLKKMIKPDGLPYKLLVYPYGDYVLSGSTIGVWAAAIDASYGKATMREPLKFDIGSNTTGDARSNITDDGYLTVYGDGEIYINASSGLANGSTMIHSVTTPENITVFNEANGNEVTSLSIAPGELVNLTADAYYQGMNLTDNDTAYTWSVSDSNLGTITSDGIFTASGQLADGTITCSAGSAKANISVSVSGDIVPPATAAPLPETDYPTITSSHSDGMFTAKIYASKGTISADNITFKVDGKKTSFTYSDDTNTLQYDFPEGFGETVHQLSVSLTDSLGYSAFKTHTVGELSALGSNYEDTEDHWAENYIAYMSQRGVVSGYDENDFRPDRNMTRAEFACMIAKYLDINVYNYRGTELPYADTDSIPDWAMMQVQALYSLGIMQGKQDGDQVLFAPSSNIRRSEYSVATARLLPEGLYRAPLNAVDAEDVPSWASGSIELLLTQGIANGYTDGSIRPSNNVTRAEAVKILFGLG